MRIDLFVALVLGLQQLPPPRATGPAPPVNDPITVRGCLEGRFLRILEHDSSDLSGIRDIRLKGPRGVMRTLKDHQHRYVEVTGKLDLGRLDRIETRRKAKAGSKGTISIVASSEQLPGGSPITGNEPTADPMLEVAAFTPLAEQCPSP